MQGSGVEIKKRKLSLKNVKTNKNGSVENIDVHFKSSIPVPKSDLIKVDTVDFTREDIHEKLSDKSQENAGVSIVTNAGLLKIRALIEQFRDEIPQPLCPLPAYEGPSQLTAATTQVTETTPTHISPLPHLCLSTLRMRNLISAARRDMMETAAQCVSVISDEDKRTSRHSDVTELSSKDTNTPLPRHWCIDKLPISDSDVNETAGCSKYVIPDPVNHRTTHPVTNKAASVHTFTPHSADLRNVTKPTSSQIGESHSYRMTGTNYPKADKPSTVNLNSQNLCSQGDIQEAVVRTNIGTAVRTHTSEQTLKRPVERRRRDQVEECTQGSSNFGGASRSCADLGGGTQEDLLTNCPLCSEEFPHGMGQMAIDHHIAQCVAAADEETTW